MRAWAYGCAATIIAISIAVGCTTVPYTDRTRLMIVSESEDRALGLEAYEQILSKEPVTDDPRLTSIVEEVGRAIAAVADKPSYEWAFAVIDEPETVNAFALPGGKVAVYTGLFPVARDEAGLATVIGHEVAHALARHGAERMSQNAALQGVGLAVALATSGRSSGVQQAVMSAYGLGAQVGVMLPFSRQMESEADHIGLILMAKAGYDPMQSLGLWKRMGEIEDGRNPPEFLSTHPNYDTRMTQLREWMPEALRYYETSQRRSGDRPLPSISK